MKKSPHSPSPLPTDLECASAPLPDDIHGAASPLPGDIQRVSAPLPDDIQTAASPLPDDLQRAASYSWQRRAVETILFQGRAQLITAAGPVDLDGGTWLLARWDGLSLPDTPDGELICILPEAS